MLYFIPAWYQQNKWRELEQAWYTRRMHTEFDDTVKQVQLFHRNGNRDYKILLLSYTPNLRHFLHRQGVFHAPYWSVFDSIQEITKKKAAIFSFHNLKWPKDIEFVYTPFQVLAFQRGMRYATIEFGENGNPIEVSMYEYGILSRKNIYDDRGFLSSTIIHNNGEPFYTDYLGEDGNVKFREYTATGYIEINEKNNTYLVSLKNGYRQYTFKQSYYENISLLIAEVLQMHFEVNKSDDVFSVAMHELNVNVLKNLIMDRKYILSFYGERYRLSSHMEAVDFVENAGYIITDSEATSRYLIRDIGKDLDNIIDITPYDSRADFGISQQLTVQNILVPIDNLPDDRFEETIKRLAEYLVTNENARVHIFTRQADYGRPEYLLNRIADILENAGYDSRWTMQPDDTRQVADTDIDKEENIPTLFYVDQCVDELSVSKCIREQRVLLDMRHNPDLYLQINCISTAIPQIVRRPTQYIENAKNGLVVKKLENIPFALDYFLNGLTNWNKAKIYSYEIGQQYTTRKLLEKWEHVLTAVEK